MRFAFHADNVLRSLQYTTYETANLSNAHRALLQIVQITSLNIYMLWHTQYKTQQSSPSKCLCEWRYVRNIGYVT